ncbi:MAG: 3-hydroxybutyrate dehydrogenase [Cellvibrionales bacterium]|nr:3-hydroxybutyrate dehydrogenase [Cellvibrionales bacterium]
MQPKTALITGAARGLGFALAEYLYQQGCQVWLSDLDVAAAQQAARQIAGDDPRLVPLRLDLSSQRDIEAAVTAIEAATGRVDILLNNAGLQHVARLEDFPVDMWQHIIAVMLVGPAMLTRACLPLMRAAGYGRIVNIGSIHSLVASPYKSAYVAAKHGLLGFAKTVALEVAEQDITINTLCPAYLKTALVKQQIAEQARTHGMAEEDVIDQIMLAPMPKKCFISTDEVCGALGFLLSDAARNVSAQTLVLDGAWTAR